MAKHFKHEGAGEAPLSQTTPDDARTGDGAQAPGSANVGRSAAMMSVLVIFSRITGFVRTWGQAFALGTTLLSSCYTVANNLPNQLYELVIGGMIITAFLPVYLDVKQRLGRKGANAYISNLLSLLLIILGVGFVLCLVFAAPLIWVQSAGTDQSTMTDAVVLFRFFAIEVVLYCLSSIASGILNAERDYFWSNAAPIFNNVICTVSFIGYAVLSGSHPALAFGILAIGNPLGVLVQVLMQIPSLRRHGVRLTLHVDIHDPAIKETLSIGLPTLVVTVCSFVTTSVMTSMALVAVPEQGSSIQYYARLWYTLPYAVLAVPITVALFTEMSDSFAKGRLKDFAAQVSSGMRQVVFVLMPFMLYLIVFSRPLMSLMRIGQFDAESATLTAAYLSTLALALPFYGLSTFFQKAFSSMRHMMSFAAANIIASVAQVAFTVALTPVLGIHAVSLGSALYMVLLDVISIGIIRKKVDGIELAPFFGAFARSLALGVAGAAVGAVILHLMGGDVGALTLPRALVVLVAGGVPSVAVTFGLAVALRIPEAAFFTRIVKKVARR